MYFLKLNFLLSVDESNNIIFYIRNMSSFSTAARHSGVKRPVRLPSRAWSMVVISVTIMREGSLSSFLSASSADERRT